MEKHKIENTIKEIVLLATIELDRNHMREDYYALYSEIIEEIMIKAPKKENRLYDYVHLLEQEDELYSPYSSYEFGIHSKLISEHIDVNLNDIFSIYLKEIEQKNSDILKKKDRCFNELCYLLGERTDLMLDFTNLFHDCNSIIRNNLKIFFDMGYNSIII